MPDTTFSFKNIPSSTTFCVFDADTKEKAHIGEVQLGDSSMVISTPSSWTTPTRTLRSKEYFLPEAFKGFTPGSTVTFSGDDFYIDISQGETPPERNRKAVEALIHQSAHASLFDARQRFFASLIALQSYYEYLTFGMLVLSDQLTEKGYKKLYKHSVQTKQAFASTNTSFFATKIDICPGKSVTSMVTLKQARELLPNFEEVRKLRNAVAHSWCYRDLPRHDIVDRLKKTQLPLPPIQTNADDEAFYTSAQHCLLALYAAAENTVGRQVKVFAERDWVRREREERGY